MPRKPPGVKAKGLGARLRVCREEAGLSLREASEAVDWDKSTLSRLETGKRNVNADEVAQLLGVFRVRGQVKKEIMALARTLDEPGWWDQGLEGLPKESATLAEYESEAVHITDWAPLLIPGLLQTPDYSRAWMMADGIDQAGIELRLRARARRQKILLGPVRYTAYIGEAALRTPVGDAATSARQVAAIRKAAQADNIVVRVVPMDVGPHRGQLGAFLTLEFESAPSVAYAELLRSSVFMDEPRHTSPYFEALPRLAAVALGETESARLLTRIQARWKGHVGADRMD